MCYRRPPIEHLLQEASGSNFCFIGKKFHATGRALGVHAISTLPMANFYAIDRAIGCRLP